VNEPINTKWIRECACLTSACIWSRTYHVITSQLMTTDTVDPTWRSKLVNESINTKWIRECACLTSACIWSGTYHVITSQLITTGTVDPTWGSKLVNESNQSIQNWSDNVHVWRQHAFGHGPITSLLPNLWRHKFARGHGSPMKINWYCDKFVIDYST
jgi:hypothetical protein